MLHDVSLKKKPKILRHFYLAQLCVPKIKDVFPLGNQKFRGIIVSNFTFILYLVLDCQMDLPFPEHGKNLIKIT